ncbi:MAG: lactonase family protein [Fimbriimonas sp.]|nr:lactonase family protein [Fimbriimonas sp.]
MLPGLLLALPSLIPPPADISFYVGTYTSGQGSKGIYRIQLNSETGAMSEPELAAESPNPSFLVADSKHHALYAVDESNQGYLSAFSIEPNGNLKFLNRQSSQGSAPCHISIGAKGQKVFVANYSDGVLASFPIQPDGSLGSVDWQFKNKGAGPNSDRQEGPHAHSFYTDGRGRFTVSCDLGTDELLVFPIVPSGSPMMRVKLPPGSGPRHVAIGSNGKFVYVCNEMASTVSTIQIKSTGWSVVQTVGTLPPGTSVPDSTTAEIQCHPSGKWVYVSNRGHDSIAVFEVQADGTLKSIDVHKVGVRIPRGFGIDPSGKWLVVAGQNSNDIESYRIDEHSGLISGSASKIRLPSPVCILFPKP